MTIAKRVFDKLKNLLGNERPPAPSDDEPEAAPPRPGAPTAVSARRPARPRAARSDPGLSGGRPRSPSGAFEPLDAPAIGETAHRPRRRLHCRRVTGLRIPAAGLFG